MRIRARVFARATGASCAILGACTSPLPAGTDAATTDATVTDSGARVGGGPVLIAAPRRVRGTLPACAA